MKNLSSESVMGLSPQWRISFFLCFFFDSWLLSWAFTWGLGLCSIWGPQTWEGLSFPMSYIRTGLNFGHFPVARFCMPLVSAEGIHLWTFLALGAFPLLVTFSSHSEVSSFLVPDSFSGTPPAVGPPQLQLGLKINGCFSRLPINTTHWGYYQSSPLI